MAVAVIAALLVSFLVYLLVGLRLHRKKRSVADFMPMGGSRKFVRSSGEFSASTVATTLSLATVVIAFFELAPVMGGWLYWCVFTTALGLWLVQRLSRRIFIKLKAGGGAAVKQSRSLHEFLGNTYTSGSSRRVRLIAAGCTLLGFLAAFAVELTVGSRFLGALLPQVPSWLVVVVLSAVAFTYTSLGGFRAVVLTDKLQMVAIWGLLTAMAVFFIWYIGSNGGWSANWQRIPDDIRSLTPVPGLLSFLLGIFVINVCAYLADMSVWQRIAGAGETATVSKGLSRSVWGSMLTWSAIITFALLAMMFQPFDSSRPLSVFLQLMGTQFGLLGQVLLFFMVLGLFGAMLSTASTQLIAISQTLYYDLRTNKTHRTASAELGYSRWLLLGSATIAMLLVELLNALGLRIVDLVFGIYGAQLSLLPPVLLALYQPLHKVQPLYRAAAWAIGLGFAAGWVLTLVGRLTGHFDWVTMAPVGSLVVSGVIMAVAIKR
jgi:Na+/proline symporter